MRIIVAVALGWANSAIITGGLFKLQFWQGADHLLLTGLVTVGLILLIATVLYFRNKADYSDYYKRIIKRIAIYGGFGLFFLFQNLNNIGNTIIITIP